MVFNGHRMIGRLAVETKTNTVKNKFAGYKNQYAAYIAKPGRSRAMAIKMKCVECVNFEDVRERVSNCNASSCAIHSFRPFQKSLKVVE